VLDVREECGNTNFRWEGHENLGISVSGVLGVLPDGAGFAGHGSIVQVTWLKESVEYRGYEQGFVIRLLFGSGRC
jgi:hypothetical protein